jgi:hypothetical protein
MLGALDISIVIPGHGEPFTDVAGALERARKRVAAFAGDSRRIARHALKVNLMFSLLDKQRMPLAAFPHTSTAWACIEISMHFSSVSPRPTGRVADLRAREGGRRQDCRGRCRARAGRRRMMIEGRLRRLRA